jgi:hypothetical protein
MAQLMKFATGNLSHLVSPPFGVELDDYPNELGIESDEARNAALRAGDDDEEEEEKEDEDEDEKPKKGKGKGDDDGEEDGKGKGKGKGKGDDDDDDDDGKGKGKGKGRGGDDDDDEPKKSNTMLFVIIGGVAVLFCCICPIIGLVMRFAFGF